MSTTWDPCMDLINNQHDNLCGTVYDRRLTGATRLWRIPWWPLATPHPLRAQSHGYWWNNVSLASTTQDGV